MRIRIAIGVAFGLVAMLLVVNVRSSNAAPKETGLQGVWTLSHGEAEGEALGEKQLKDGELIIQDDQYAVHLVDLGIIKGTQKLNSKAKPKTIDITDSTGPHKGETCLGIYELDGNEFRVVFARAGQPRPAKFATVKGSGHWMHVWKKATK